MSFRTTGNPVSDRPDLNRILAIGLNHAMASHTMPPDLTAPSIGKVMYTVLECKKPMMLPEPEPVPRLGPNAAIKLVRKGIDSHCEEICYREEIAAPLLLDIQDARKATLDPSQTHICITNPLCNNHKSSDEIADFYGLITASYKLKMLKGSNKWTVEVLVRRRFVTSMWDIPRVNDQIRVGTTHELAQEYDLSDKIANAEAFQATWGTAVETLSCSYLKSAPGWDDGANAYALYHAKKVTMVTNLWEALRKTSSSENGESFGGFSFLPPASHERVEMRSLYDQIEHTTSELVSIHSKMTEAPPGSVNFHTGDLVDELNECGNSIRELYEQYRNLAKSPPIAQWFLTQAAVFPNDLISLQEAKFLLAIIRQLFASTIESLLWAPTEEFGSLHLDKFVNDFPGKRSRN